MSDTDTTYEPRTVPMPDEPVVVRVSPKPEVEPDLRSGSSPSPASDDQDRIETQAGAGNDPIDAPDESKQQPSESGPRIIALMNQKGGVGKTTTAVNLGAGLARQGQRVLMIDLDPQAHLSLHLGIDPDGLDAEAGGKSMYHLLAESETTATEIVQQADDGVAVLPAEVSLAGVEAELADRVVTGAAQTVLKTKCRDLTRQFDTVIIDCPPSLGLLTINALTLAQEVIVPMQAHFLALQGLGKLLETISMLRQGINTDLVVSGIVLCMHERQTILANEVINDLNGFLEAARGTDAPWRDAVVYQPPIRRNIKLAEAPSFGQSIFQYAPDCHGSEDYAALAASVAKHRIMN